MLKSKLKNTYNEKYPEEGLNSYKKKQKNFFKTVFGEKRQRTILAI